ncbi:MAG: helix-turn-helix domain-containing protein, partial [Gemmatimonadetes bacterium]|nr:helix-turn-helix domain-containing protein [Gemmatimonadota bacterium]
MGKSLSDDLRVRVVEAVEAGASRRQAAARFGVSVSSAIRWARSWNTQGDVRAKPQGGDRDQIRAVAAGEGIEAAFRSVGVTQLVRGGQTMNPSAAEILEAIESCRAQQVVVLPNNKNIIAAAQQAADSSEKLVSVVPSRSVPQGVSAVLALNPDLSFDENAEAMERALASVRSAEVTRAVRATTID